MTKEQFLKMYGQPNTVVSFKNDAEKMEFLKECEKFDIKWKRGQNATQYPPSTYVYIHSGGLTTASYTFCESKIEYTITPSPKSLIKDGWMGKKRLGSKVYFLPSEDIYVCKILGIFDLRLYEDDVCNRFNNDHDIMELYDNLGNLQWKREEKSAKDIEIERIQAEMNKLADDLSKLKGE